MIQQKTNCRNCGAALDIWKPNCEFCGTKNVNLTALDLASGEPANFIFKMPNNIKVVDKEGMEIFLSVLAVPSLEVMTITSNPVSVYGGWGNCPIATHDAGRELEMQLKLNAVSKKVNDRDVLCEVRYGE